MTGEKRITKRRMKEDKLVSSTFKATEYIQKNQTPFIVGTLVVAAVFVLVVFMRWSGDRKRNDQTFNHHRQSNVRPAFSGL